MKMSLFDEVANFQFLVLSPKGFWIGRSSINVDPDSSYLFPCNWNYRICCWCDLPLNRLTAGVVTLRPPAMPCWLTTKSLAIWQSGPGRGLKHFRGEGYLSCYSWWLIVFSYWENYLCAGIFNLCLGRCLHVAPPCGSLDKCAAGGTFDDRLGRFLICHSIFLDLTAII
jgi:hypothetical protein